VEILALTVSITSRFMPQPTLLLIMGVGLTGSEITKLLGERVLALDVELSFGGDHFTAPAAASIGSRSGTD